jgi:hypothetical protein
MKPSQGLWVWNKSRCEDGDPARVVETCKQYKIGHVLVKTNDGKGVFNGQLRPWVEALQTARVNVWGWTYTYGHDPELEAQAFSDRCVSLGIDKLCVDAEIEYKGHPDLAERFMTRLLRESPQKIIGVSSYYLPKNHPTFPWKIFYSHADYALPQVYFYNNPPDLALSKSLAQHMEYRNRNDVPIPVLPVGSAYPEATGSAENMRTFLKGVEAAGLGQCSWWSWEHLRSEYWQVLAEP